MKRNLITLLFLTGGVIFGNWPTIAIARQRNNITAGKLIVEPPTLISLGFEWHVGGDANRNASVTASYCKRGESNWHEGLPLFRINGERTVFWDSLDYTAPNMFAGSIFDLELDTEYECRFVLADPDGVAGNQQETVTVRTRAEPQPSAAGCVFHVYPAGYQGPKQEPVYIGLLAAYYTAAIGSDWNNASPPNLNDPTRLVSPSEVDLRLREGSAAVDAGVVLPNITDGYTGKAPDFGAYELGQELPHYGPRR